VTAPPLIKGLEPGTVLVGKYRVERVLGVGGMGMVVAAHHLQLDERIALKFLLAEVAFHPDAAKRFVREARAAVKIKSDHVARVSDVGTLDDGLPYLVMEYLEGGDLAVELERRGRFSVEEAVELVLQACEAIAEAHALGIVHRDLKPANLFLTRRPGGVPWIKVLDFGISKVSSGTDVAMTRTAAVMGSPLYMSPEQIRASKDVDARADIWALGVILYELVAGRGPFSSETLFELSVKIAVEPPEPFPRAAAVPPGLQGVILRCLEKDRERRFANVALLAHALAPFASRRAAASIECISNALGAAGARTPTGALASKSSPLGGDGTTAPLDVDPRGSFPEAHSAEQAMLGRGSATRDGFAGTDLGAEARLRKPGAAMRVVAVVLALGTLAVGGALLLRSGASSDRGDTPSSGAPGVTPGSAAVSSPAKPPLVEVTPAPVAPTAEPVVAPPSTPPPAVSAASASSSGPAIPAVRARPAGRVRGGAAGSKNGRTAPEGQGTARPEPASAPPPAPAPKSTAAPVDIFNQRKFD
jgi:serine/threonine-protein kinase